jgi:hypothetical protein
MRKGGVDKPNVLAKQTNKQTNKQFKTNKT